MQREDKRRWLHTKTNPRIRPKNPPERKMISNLQQTSFTSPNTETGTLAFSFSNKECARMDSLCLYPSMTFNCPCFKENGILLFLVGVSWMQSTADPKNNNLSGGCQTCAERHTCDPGMRRRPKKTTVVQHVERLPEWSPPPPSSPSLRLRPDDGTRPCTCVQGTEKSIPNSWIHVSTPAMFT